ncbi:hypothetical protein WHI96_26845 [Pseudonocardia tropica]|uniref:Uncharacterized protein n=1 Tax=Pseudonocardia tropica TaxID=681289 RepID=A0ABV1K2I2_9PSEU
MSDPNQPLGDLTHADVAPGGLSLVVIYTEQLVLQRRFGVS